MLLKGFFRVQPFNPTLNKETLLFEKNTSGGYSYTIPAKYKGKSIRIVISGAGGGMWSGVVNQAAPDIIWYGGNGELYEYQFSNSNQNIITGIIGAHGVKSSSAQEPNGGSGYSNGGTGTIFGDYLYSKGGGGGGSSSLVIDNKFIYEVSAGGGMNYEKVTGGYGGGPRGGQGGQNAGNGYGAKGAVWRRGAPSNTEGEDGYIRIYVLP